MEGARVFPQTGPPYSMLWGVLKVPKLDRSCRLMWVLTRPGHSVSEVNVCSPYPLCYCRVSGFTPLSVYIYAWCTSVCGVYLCMVYICVQCTSVYFYIYVRMFAPISYPSHAPRDDPIPTPASHLDCPLHVVLVTSHEVH